MTQIFGATKDTACKSCHQIIYDEFYSSMHSKSSLSKNELHNAIWQNHPNAASQNYTCKKCHTPTDANGISCIDCHQIETIAHANQSNTNNLTAKEKYFFGADANQKGSVKTFEKQNSFFGLFSGPSGSPYHTIDYSNQNFYDGQVCAGCHSHNKNEQNITLCEMKSQNNTKQNCITCHMPQIKGSATSIKITKTHAFHGFAGIYNKPQLLEKYIELKLNGDNVSLKNLAPHDLTLQPLRVGILQVKINNKIVFEKKFEKIFGKNSRPSNSAEANEILNNNIIKGGETAIFRLQPKPKQNDLVEATFGVFSGDPKIATKLKIKNDIFKDFKILSKISKKY